MSTPSPRPSLSLPIRGEAPTRRMGPRRVDAEEFSLWALTAGELVVRAVRGRAVRLSSGRGCWRAHRRSASRVLQLLEQGRGDDTHARHCDGPGVAELAGVQHDRQGFHFRVVVARLRQASGLSARTAPAQGRPRTRSRPARTSSFPCCGRAGRPAEREETRFGPGRGPGAAQGWDDSCGMCGPGGPGGARNKHTCPHDRSPARAGHEAVGPSKRRPDYWDAPCGTRFNSPFSVRDLAR